MQPHLEPVDNVPHAHVAAAQVIIGAISRTLRGVGLPDAASVEGQGVVEAVRLLMDDADRQARQQGRDTLAAGVLAVVITTMVAQLQADLQARRND